MANQISLTASMRSNLQSLQQTQKLFDMTQERLSTGKKVNSAIDNPSAFYTAQSLTNRANDLNNLMDSMGQAVQTLKAADQAIEALTEFANQAKATANAARDIATGNGLGTLASSIKVVDPAADDLENGTAAAPTTLGEVMVDARDDMSRIDGTVGSLTLATALDSTNLADGDTLEVYLGGSKVKTITVAAAGATLDQVNSDADTVGDLLTAINNIEGVSASLNGDGTLSFISDNGEALSLVGTSAGGAWGTDLGVDEATVVDLSGAANLDAAQVILDGVADATSVVSTDGVLSVSAAGGASGSSVSVFDVSGDFAANYGLSGTNTSGDDAEALASRASYASEFDNIRAQIDSLAKDASYKGVNLFQGDDLTVNFNEDRSSQLVIKGGEFDTQGLNINASTSNWADNTSIDTAIAEVEAAIKTLRDQATTFGNNLSVVENRENFTTNLINTLQAGADKLTLADMNEEGANMLALQTRQQLATNSLSLASQSAQAVLKLF